MHIINDYSDKERYLNELRDLTKCNKVVERPKKPLTPYMLFVRAVSSFSIIPFRLDPKS